MDDQRTFFGAFEAAEASLSRNTDPRTSRLAEPTHGMRMTACQFVVSVLWQREPMTANEIAQLCESSPHNTAGTIAETFRKRVHELVRIGRVEVAGERQCRVTGKVATVYRSQS